MITEPVIRIQSGVAKVFICIAMEIICAALCGDLNDASTVAAKFGAHIVRRDAKLLNRVLSRNQGVDIVLRYVLPHTINEEQALSAECATNLIVAVGNSLGLPASLKVAASTIGHCAALGPAAGCHAWYKIEQVVYIASVQRSLLHLPTFDNSLQSGTIRMEIAWCSAHRHTL